ncbi:ankyrin repeat domain-containing protein SOWAHC-like [Coregonus clupeaformis]|uniref:ankyrin repeat domain-containing protein SOWAHC-like n=1 Tax=Coregonus clupeaformis TaxID=59861 RepID=UPI001E1C64E8|nr:ankyrin repeat domain-containing protein SOWAHC-like [Coregonus clupeaformis]
MTAGVAGYTALHLASIHGHHHIIQLLINTYNARTNIRDYHGKHAVHYWSGNADVFNKPGSQSCGKWSSKGGRKAQRYTNLPSLLLSRSRSQGNLNNLEFGTAPQTPRSPSSMDFHSFPSPQLYGDHF